MKQGNIMNFFGKKKDNKEAAASTPQKSDQLQVSDSKLQAVKGSEKKVQEDIVQINEGNNHTNSNSKKKDIAIPEEKKNKNQQLQQSQASVMSASTQSQSQEAKKLEDSPQKVDNKKKNGKKQQIEQDLTSAQKNNENDTEEEFVFVSKKDRLAASGRKRNVIDSEDDDEHNNNDHKDKDSEDHIEEKKQPKEQQSSGKKLKKQPAKKTTEKQQITKKQEIEEEKEEEEELSKVIESVSHKQTIETVDKSTSNSKSKAASIFQTKTDSKTAKTTEQPLSKDKPSNELNEEKQSKSKESTLESVKKPIKDTTDNDCPDVFEQSLSKLSADKYNPIRDAGFNQGGNVPFGFLCAGFEHVAEQEGKNSKGVMIETMSRVFKSIILLNTDQIYPAYMFCIMKIAPDYQSNELGVGREILQKAISQCCGKTVSQIRDSLNKLGDLGKVAAQAKATQKNISSFFVKTNVKQPSITLIRAFNDLKTIGATSGQNSTAKREGIISKFMREATPAETCYFVRFIEQNLKIGAAEKTMQAALSKAFYEIAHNITSGHTYTASEEESLSEFNFIITRCLCEFPNYEKVIETLLTVKTDIHKLLDVCKITIGIPCKPMLAKPTKSIQIILDRFKDVKFTCEYKYDGLRGQIHYDGKNVSIFSRNLEDMTLMYPDIVEFVQRHVAKSTKIQNFILDSEIVAFDRNTNKIRPFQSLATRGRVNVKLSEIDIKVCVFMFDLILINGQSLMQTTLKERRQMISENFVQEPGEFCFAEQLNTDDQEEMQEFLEKSVKVGCEGLMVKTLEENSTYEPAKRSFKWLKLKKDYIDNGLGDTLDLVPIAAIKGTGKRAGLYGAYLLAAYNEDMERYETICKIGTGFSDEILEACFKFFQDKLIPTPLNNYLVKDFKADVWFTPSVVWEIKGADLQISPVYTCGISETNLDKGIGLRFPRLLRIRDDKAPDEATSPSFIYEIYSQQAVVTNNFDDADDFY